MTKFDIAADYVLENEKSYSNNSSDKRGITYYGISERFIESLKDDDLLPHYIATGVILQNNKKMVLDVNFGSKDYIKNLTLELAKLIYQKYLWLPIYDQIENQDICNYIFDMTVQHGKQKAAELTQRAINANWRHRFAEVDGKFGPDTLREVNTHSHGHATKIVFQSCLIAVREAFFRCIIAHDNSQEQFLDKWLKRCYK